MPARIPRAIGGPAKGGDNASEFLTPLAGVSLAHIGLEQSHTGGACTAEKQTELARPAEKATSPPNVYSTPFHMLDKLADELDRIFDDFGLGHRWFSPRPRVSSTLRTGEWLPEVEVVLRNTDLVVRADLPGLTKDDVKVNITENTLTIQGERKREHEEEKGGVYRSERSYGSFFRSITLSEGAITDQAKATFKDGVLEIAMPAPPESVKHGRRLDISEPATPKQ
jgi:HSP20 family protein